MTVRELSQLYYLKKLIERDNRRLSELESRLLPGTMNLTGMPHNPSPKNMMEELVPVIADLKDKIRAENQRYIECEMEIEEYISSIEDYHIRLIFLHRFVDLMTWEQVAIHIGGGNTEDSVKKAAYRYLKKTEK